MRQFFGEEMQCQVEPGPVIKWLGLERFPHAAGAWLGLRHKADGQKEDSRAGSCSGSTESASQGTGKCLSLGFLICQLEVAEKVCWGKPGRYLACPWNFFCQHFYARSIFLWNLFPSTWCCLLQRSTCATRSASVSLSTVTCWEFELAGGRPDRQVGAYRRRSHWVPRDRGRWGGRSDWEGEAAKKKEKGWNQGQGGLSRSRGRMQAPGTWLVGLFCLLQVNSASVFGLSRKHNAHKSNSVKCSVKIKWLHLVTKLENSIVWVRCALLFLIRKDVHT